MQASYEELFRLLDRLRGKLDELTEVQKQKNDAVRRDDLLGVDECMKKEQVISLSLRSMDQQREKLLRSLGLENLPVSALPGRCPEPLRQKARETAERLLGSYAIYKSAALTARNTLEINLHQIEKIIRELEPEDPDAGPASVADIRA